MLKNFFMMGLLAAAAPAVASSVPIATAPQGPTISLAGGSVTDGTLNNEALSPLATESSLFAGNIGPTSSDGPNLPDGDAGLNGPSITGLLGTPGPGATPPEGSTIPGLNTSTNFGQDDGGQGQGFPPPMPLPSAGLMGLAGLAGLAATRRRRS